MIPIVIDQHAEECALLWLRRDWAAGQPHFSLVDLAELDLRIDAHCEGLSVAGTAGWEVCLRELKWQQPGEVFAAAMTALDNCQDSYLESVLEAVDGSPHLERPLVSALAWQGRDAQEWPLRDWLSGTPLQNRLALTALAVQRAVPAELLEESLSSPDPHTRARAARMVGEMGRLDMIDQLRPLLDVESCGDWAAWSQSLLVSESDTGRLLDSSLLECSEKARSVLPILLHRLERSIAIDWIRRLAREADRSRLAVVGAGILGDPELLPWLIDLMEDPDLARLAGESCTAMTGLELDSQPFEGEPPEGFEAGPSEDSDDDDVQMDPDESLPWPNVGAVRDWWSAKGDSFQSGVRYQIGSHLDAANAGKILCEGNQRQRAAAALYLAMAEPGHPLFEVRSHGAGQQRTLRLA